jgi:oxygen-independent coproporphyrinogen-3 oxidase
MAKYVAKIERQAEVLSEATAGERALARFAVGGGTPTVLEPPLLERLLRLPLRYFGTPLRRIPTSVEVSPTTATEDRLEVLHNQGVNRISIGVQSFIEKEVHAIGRPQSSEEVHAALQRLRHFPVLNIDLIYGLPSQTVDSWLVSLEAALGYRPEELYLYPLYVRPNTRLGQSGFSPRASSPVMRFLYREGRDLLRANGYEQMSMRFFQRETKVSQGPVYCCQTDGMVGLGCGARSYTSGLHYASPFGVGPSAVQAILDQWMSQTADQLACATWGYRLSQEERQRRFVIQSLLTRPGLVETEYHRLFGKAVLASFPDLGTLNDLGLTEYVNGLWRLTPRGLEWSDTIGPALYSAGNRLLLERFARS